ncbi:methanobactin biosynthesis protein MbnC [Plasticicumulans acidivorans]|uniref:Methanobactin biosynthesis cassette protein MbnC n=1 Tax=Plasticicumulans acidivorans TaxID=886464 RepID=A0A317MZM1_9GAMM|nr:methanobactin biosynthesis protein MbnC [Plasticicumulans acidivorans]PWV65657.1 methanobactin biosynthesis cassette protein MbnC [Plasticicumulans acidivorans]
MPPESVLPEPQWKDAELLDALLIPALQGNFPRDSAAFVRIDTSLRVYWHTLFDICPQLLELSGPDGLAIFRPFMAWAAQQQLSMNWAVYLWLCRWLQQSEFAARVDEELVFTLMAASVARWATGDRSADCGIVLSAAGHGDLLVGWKCHTPDGGRAIERVGLATPLPEPDEQFGYFTLPDFALDRFDGWQAVPR